VCKPGNPRPNGAGCSDGLTCNGNETCQQGICTGGTPLTNGTSCGDTNPCNGADTCQQGACVTGVVPPNGTSCSDGDLCNGTETCQGAACVPGPQAPNGTSCGDANTCNGTETCQQGVCQSGANRCTLDTCNPGTGCQHSVLPNGTPCDDDDVCNGLQTCQSAVCGSGTPLSCGALVCDPFAGCVSDKVITGRKLVLSATRQPGSGVNLKVKAKGQIRTSAPPVVGTAGDPVLHGGVVRIRSLAGGFDERFHLPSFNWDYVGDPADNLGFRYVDRGQSGAIRAVVVRDGALSKIKGNGLALPSALINDPEPVEVSLIIGNQRYCLGFGGDITFDRERRFAATDAPPPGSCPP
jgi:hypothetical protein